MKSFQDKDLQSFVGNLLRYGVWAAMTIVVAGLLLYLFNHGGATAGYGSFNEEEVFRPAAFLRLLLSGNSEAIMEAGIIVLIATPIARVLFTLIGFWLEKDYLYTFIAFIVLGIIACSLLLGVAAH